jgi:hypothetical protein
LGIYIVVIAVKNAELVPRAASKTSELVRREEEKGKKFILLKMKNYHVLE